VKEMGREHFVGEKDVQVLEDDDFIIVDRYWFSNIVLNVLFLIYDVCCFILWNNIANTETLSFWNVGATWRFYFLYLPNVRCFTQFCNRSFTFCVKILLNIW
jgi:hypothetical protein